MLLNLILIVILFISHILKHLNRNLSVKKHDGIDSTHLSHMRKCIHLLNVLSIIGTSISLEILHVSIVDALNYDEQS